jgi:hypothetical protein
MAMVVGENRSPDPIIKLIPGVTISSIDTTSTRLQSLHKSLNFVSLIQTTLYNYIVLIEDNNCLKSCQKGKLYILLDGEIIFYCQGMHKSRWMHDKCLQYPYALQT